MFRSQKTLKKRRIKLYNTLAPPVLLYSSEKWIINAGHAQRITAAEMKYKRKTAEYTWTDYNTNKETAKELNITPVLEKIQEYRKNWLQHINRMPHNRLPRIQKAINRQKKTRGNRETSRCARSERVKKWPNSMLAR
jgi:hypothetical protein